MKVTIVVDFVHVPADTCGTPPPDCTPTTTSSRAVGAPPGDTGARRTAPAKWPPASAAKRPNARLHGTRRQPADEAAAYLTNKAPYLDYPTALINGWPIATGIVEGACRHLVEDRIDLTGARWGLAGAEAILKLRAIKANGDFEEYWRYHLTQRTPPRPRSPLPQPHHPAT